MTTNEEVNTDSSNAVFLAVAAQNYADADLAFWRLKDVLDDPANPVQLEHLDKLRERRKETYADLVAWVMLVEAERLGTTPPATPAKAQAVTNIVITNNIPPKAADGVRAAIQAELRNGRQPFGMIR